MPPGSARVLRRDDLPSRGHRQSEGKVYLDSVSEIVAEVLFFHHEQSQSTPLTVSCTRVSPCWSAAMFFELMIRTHQISVPRRLLIGTYGLDPPVEREFVPREDCEIAGRFLES